MKGEHFCYGSVNDDGTKLRCLCVTCVHDDEVCCINHPGKDCPRQGVPDECPDYEAETEEEAERDE